MTGRTTFYRQCREAAAAMTGPLQLIGGDVARDWSAWMEGAIFRRGCHDVSVTHPRW